MENIISLKELRFKLTKYADKIEKKGESFLVLKRSRPIFKIVPVDEKTTWETVVDFTEINPEGVPAKDVLKALKELA